MENIETLWQNGLKDIEAKHSSFFADKETPTVNRSAEIEDFVLTPSTGGYYFTSVYGYDLSNHIKKEVKILADSIAGLKYPRKLA